MKRVLVCGLVWVSLGCEVSPNDIERWKDSERGPLKIRTAFSDAKQNAEVRTLAAVALVDIGRLDELEKDLQNLPASETRGILDSVLEQLIQRMKGANPKAPPNPAQVRAKDAVFSLRIYASEATRAQAESALIDWLTIDLPGRLVLGSHSAEKILVALGPKAGPALAKALSLEALDLVEPATLLSKVGDQAAREQGAENLIRIAQTQGAKEQSFLALARLGGPQAVRFLNGVAQSGAAQARLLALRALQVLADPSSLPVAQAIAADRSLKDDLAVLRDDAFGVLQQIAQKGDAAARDALLGFLRDTDEKVRWTAVDALCATKREEVIALLLERLPAWAAAKPEDLRDFLEERIKKEVGVKIAPALRKLLFANNWVARLVSARLLAELGAQEDVASLERLASEDDTAIRGWPGGSTVGKEAQAAAKRLREKLP